MPDIQWDASSRWGTGNSNILPSWGMWLRVSHIEVKIWYPAIPEDREEWNNGQFSGHSGLLGNWCCLP